MKIPIINPYEIFGLCPNSNENELRKIYYELALICHPDKGGTNEDMLFLQIYN